MTLKPYFEKVRTLLLNNQVRINDIKSLLSKTDKGEIEVLTTYLANHDDLVFLFKENVRLSAILDYEDARYAIMVAPVYVSDDLVLPKKMPIIVLGLLAGIFFGLLYKIACRIWLNYKNGR